MEKERAEEERRLREGIIYIDKYDNKSVTQLVVNERGGGKIDYTNTCFHNTLIMKHAADMNTNRVENAVKT